MLIVIAILMVVIAMLLIAIAVLLAFITPLLVWLTIPSKHSLQAVVIDLFHAVKLI